MLAVGLLLQRIYGRLRKLMRSRSRAAAAGDEATRRRARPIPAPSLISRRRGARTRWGDGVLADHRLRAGPLARQRAPQGRARAGEDAAAVERKRLDEEERARRSSSRVKLRLAPQGAAVELDVASTARSSCGAPLRRDGRATVVMSKRSAPPAVVPAPPPDLHRHLRRRGLTRFLLAVPGAPVYLAGDPHASAIAPGGIYGRRPSTRRGWRSASALFACALQQKLIGENMGRFVSVRRAVDINTTFMRVLRIHLSQRRVMTAAKVAILVGGPDCDLGHRRHPAAAADPDPDWHAPVSTSSSPSPSAAPS